MNHRIIIIVRQFGGGGYEVAQGLPDLLGTPLYDKNLMEMAVEKMEHSPVNVEKIDEFTPSTFLANYQIPKESNSVTGYGLSLNDSTYITQTIITEALARKGLYVIVGRCGDYVLRNYPDLVNVLICAFTDDRVCRTMERYNPTEKDAINAIKSTDRRRKNYYKNYTRHKWGSTDSHQMLLNISKLGMDKTIRVIKGIYESD